HSNTGIGQFGIFWPAFESGEAVFVDPGVWYYWLDHSRLVYQLPLPVGQRRGVVKEYLFACGRCFPHLGVVQFYSPEDPAGSETAGYKEWHFGDLGSRCHTIAGEQELFDFLCVIGVDMH